MHLTRIAVLPLLTALLPGQDNLGLLQNVDPSYSVRGDGWIPANHPSIQFTRIDVESYAAWGHDDNSPGGRVFTGLHFVIQDFNRATPDAFRLVAYTEFQPQTNTPDIANPLATTAAISMPAGPPGIGAFDVTANFATPIIAPGSVDVFVGLHQLNVVNVLAQDGLTVWITTAEDGPQWTIRDIPGAGAPTPGPFHGDTYAGFHVPATSLTDWMSRSQFHIEPIVLAPGGLASALHHGDGLHPAANQAQGTSCMLSALHPDVRNPPLTTGRADDLGMHFVRTGMPNGAPVLWLGDMRPSFAPALPLSTVLPGAVGVLCVDPATTVILGASLAGNGMASHVLTIPTALRGNLANLALVRQAVAFDPTSATFLAGPGQLQTL